MSIPEHAYAVILAGGGGTRLWPKSRQKKPKHLLPLFGKETILQLTFERMKAIFPVERIFIITHVNHLEEAQRQLPEMPKDNWIVEPEAKNTAVAMGVAAIYISDRDPEATLINLPADHIIKDLDKFGRAVVNATTVAGETDNIVAIGIKPRFAHTGLGYIRIGELINNTPAFKGRGFKEKPDLSTAQAFLASGEYLWNGGIYSWSAKNILKELAEHTPDLKAEIDRLVPVLGTDKEKSTLEDFYKKVQSTQIDVAVSEKAANLAVVPGDFDWSDIGDWKVMYDTGAKDSSGNVVSNENNYLQIDTNDSLIENNGRLIVTIGMKDIVVVDTEDALLICPKDRSQDVKKIVEKLKEGRKELL